MIPQVAITKTDGNTGVVRPSADGVLAIIAPSEKGTVNQPASYARQDLALTDFGKGHLVEAAAYDLTVAGKPVVLIKGQASVAATNSAVVHTGAGSSVVTVSGTTLDDYEAEIVFVTGGTQGIAGATLKWSLDGGKSYSATVALGTAVLFAIPGSGLTFNFAAGTFLAGQREQVTTTAARMNNADLVLALEALRTYGAGWDTILVSGLDATATEVATLDTWLAARETEGKYRTAIVNNAMRTAAQTEATYATAQTAVWASASSIRVTVCADGGDLVSPLTGYRQRRPMTWGLAAREMAKDISVDAAYVADGPITGYSIRDDRNNPKYHDEALFPGLDDLRLASFRSFNSRQGAYVNNPLLMSPSGSDYVYRQHARVMNKACELTFEVLTNRLSSRVKRSNTTGYINEEDAQEIEGLVQAKLDQELVNANRVSGARFVLNRTDDLRPNSGATVNCEVQVTALAYIKRFQVNARFVRTIAVNAS